MSGAMTMVKGFVYNNNFRRGKNGKFHSTDWGGNGYTGVKLKYAKNLSKTVGRVGSVLSFYSIGATEFAYQNGEISKDRRDNEKVINGIGFLGVPGAAFSFGWNLGYLIEDTCDCNIQLNWEAIGKKRWDAIWADPDKPLPYKSVINYDVLLKDVRTKESNHGF